MHMDSLLNDSCRVAFAGLIYNLDTLFQRANLKGESPADALRSILGRAPVLEGETAPFSPQGSDEANGETLEKVVTHLQRPETFLQSVVATAGRLSAGFERELYDDEGKSAKAQNPLRTRLRALWKTHDGGVCAPTRCCGNRVLVPRDPDPWDGSDRKAI